MDPSQPDAGSLIVSDCKRLERQGAEDRLRGRLDTMQRLTQSIHVPIIELNVVSGVHARPDADRCADNERHGLSFGFSEGLGRWAIVATLVEELMRLCSEVHKHTCTKPLRGRR